MKRMNPTDVVAAYEATGLIPVRRAWETQDGRAGCAIDAVARHRQNANGEDWAADNLHEMYTRGFVDAWDADQPQILDETGSTQEYLIGYWDAILCRDAVEQAFGSDSIVIEEPNKADEPTS